jgi:hypothetical protein
MIPKKKKKKKNDQTIINSRKTKVMMRQKLYRIRRTNIQSEEMIEQMQHFKYLGSSVDQDGKHIMEISSRIAQAKSAFIYPVEFYIYTIEFYPRPYS